MFILARFNVFNSRHDGSLELFVFLLCFDQDGNVRIGIFPEREEILIRLAARHLVIERIVGVQPFRAAYGFKLCISSEEHKAAPFKVSAGHQGGG
jgi:hypothetical protein